MAAGDLEDLLADEYDARRAVLALRHEVFEGPTSAARIAALGAAEEALVAAENRRVAAEAKSGTMDGVVISTDKLTSLLGVESTGLDVTVDLRMAQVPISIYHLFTSDKDPLVTGRIQNRSNKPIRRLRVTTYIDGYSASSVDTLEVKQAPQGGGEFSHLPTLFVERTRNVSELTRATVNVLIEDLDTPSVELHRTQPVWLLARTSVPFMVRDPQTKAWRDLTKYFGTFVTPNDPAVMSFLRKVATHHPQGSLVGYEEPGNAAGVESQIKAIFEALREDAKITYINSVISFAPEDASQMTQRVRLPAESLKDQEANCIDGTVLVASLIEAMTMNAAIVVVPGHAFVGWEKHPKSGEWDYLETTWIGRTDVDFAAACDEGRSLAAQFEQVAKASGDPMRFRRWSIRELRAERITPLQ
jgi:hypothetical protein